MAASNYLIKILNGRGVSTYVNSPQLIEALRCDHNFMNEVERQIILQKLVQPTPISIVVAILKEGGFADRIDFASFKLRDENH